MGVALAMAAGRGTAGGPAEGAFLLAVYSLGLGIPFILSGLGVSRLAVALKWLRNHTRAVNIASGVLLVIVGVLFFTGDMFRLSIWMQESMTALDLDFWSEI
jgi:cytochrome c-type biogenesis protein